MKIKNMVVCAVFAAILCIFSVMTIPIGPVPISMSVFGVMLTAVILGARRGIVSVVVFILLGAAGLPVFSGFRGGIPVLVGPTGGYITGYILMALVIGFLTKFLPAARTKNILGTILICMVSMLVCYIFGTIQFMLIQHTALWQALTLCVFPFAVFDFLKCIAAAIIGYTVKIGLLKAKLL